MSTPDPGTRDQPSTFRAYIELVRLPNIFTSMADVVMGFLFTHPEFTSVDAVVLWLLVVASSLLYASGVVLNDVFDWQVDVNQRPERPIPSGRISVAAARWLGWSLLLAGTAAAWGAALVAGDLRPGVVGTLLAGCVVLYDGRLKRTPFGPPAMGGCRVLNVLLGMSAVTGPWQEPHWLAAAAIGTYIAGVTWFARTEAQKSSRLSLAGATTVILLGIGVLSLLPGVLVRASIQIDPLLESQPGRWIVLMALLSAMIGVRCLRAVINPEPYWVQIAVKQCILSLVILDAAACFAVRGLPGAVAVLLLLLPAVVLGHWIRST